MSDRPSHRWYQMSLRTLLILVLMAAAYFAGVATMLRRVERAERAAQEAQRAAHDQAELVRLYEFRARYNEDQSRVRDLVDRQIAELKASQQAAEATPSSKEPEPVKQ